MQQRIVMWGEIGTDNKALVTVELEEANATILINAFPKEQVTKEFQEQLFVEWKNGGHVTFPETTYQWKIDANQDNILPENVKVERPELITQAQSKWSRKLMSTKLLQLLTEETHLIIENIESITEYDQSLWDRAKQQWDKISAYQKKGEISWEQTTLLKEKINQVFDALKAVKRIVSEHDVEKSNQIVKEITTQIEELQAKLIYPDQWKTIFNQLKKLQDRIKEETLKWNVKRSLYDKINTVFDDLRKYRSTENVSKLNGRIEQLNQILRNMLDSIARDKDNYQAQIDKMQHYTRGKLQLEEIKNRFNHIADRIKEKEKKADGIKHTIEELKQEIEKEKTKKEQPRPETISENVLNDKLPEIDFDEVQVVATETTPTETIETPTNQE